MPSSSSRVPFTVPDWRHFGDDLCTLTIAGTVPADDPARAGSDLVLEVSPERGDPKTGVWDGYCDSLTPSVVVRAQSKALAQALLLREVRLRVNELARQVQILRQYVPLGEARTRLQEGQTVEYVCADVVKQLSRRRDGRLWQRCRVGAKWSAWRVSTGDDAADLSATFV